MKYFPIVVLCFLLLPGISIAQEDIIQDNDQQELDRDELKINVFNLIAFEFADFSYERLINEEASFGLGLLFKVGGVDDSDDFYRTFSLTPYYRRYFSKGYASGFFIEGFGMLNSGEEEIFDFDEQAGELVLSGDNYTDFALGISVGGKFISSRGFIAEIYAGIGRNFFNTDISPEIVSRGGISLGFRF